MRNGLFLAGRKILSHFPSASDCNARLISRCVSLLFIFSSFCILQTTAYFWNKTVKILHPCYYSIFCQIPSSNVWYFPLQPIASSIVGLWAHRDFGFSNTEAASLILHSVLKQISFKTFVSSPSLALGNYPIGLMYVFLPCGNIALGVEQDCVTDGKTCLYPNCHQC